MDISGLKNIVGKLGFLKSYSSLILPVVIALIGIVLFLPTQILSSSLKQKMEQESISKGVRKIKSLSGEPIAKEQWLVEKKYQDGYATDSNKIALLTKQVSNRALLSYKIFPEPKEESTLIFNEFKENFLDSIDGLVERVNGRECPTESELSRHSQSSPGKTSGYYGSTGKSSSINTNETIIDVLCQSKARSASVYVNAYDLAGYNFWEQFEYSGRDKALVDCWYWQLGYWIIEDVFDTVDDLNVDSESVFTSKVKRLMGVNFERGQGSVSRSSRGKNFSAKPPKYIREIKDGLADSYTTRVCDEEIDVIHFNVSTVLSTDSILSFIQELCSSKRHTFRGFYGTEASQELKHNQITILDIKIMSVDPEMSEHKLYRYGLDAVVRLDLSCEYIFNKEGYDEIKPQLVKAEFEETKKVATPAARRPVRRGGRGGGR